MDDILLDYSDTDNLEKMFKETKLLLFCKLQIAPEKLQRSDSINYLHYKISQQKFDHKRNRSEEISCKLLMIFKN